MNDKSEFLLAALADKQSTIRAVDVKCGFLFFVIFYPFFRLESIYSMAVDLMSHSVLYLMPVFLVGVVWFMSLLVLFRAVSSIGNPADRIVGSPRRSTYFMPGLFDLSSWAAFLNPSCKSSLSLDEMIKDIPSSERDTERELVFENMKLAYIRDLKNKRVNFCIGLIALWVIAGAALWILGINH